ncbi:hypothetical protein OAF45_00040 [Candidatus Latescibacteria bacterium]|nr:hypothetical protein [Candidatus Latescibacterota bacterium]
MTEYNDNWSRIWQELSAAATGAVEITLPVAIVAAVYIIGQAMVDASGD